MLIKIRRFAGRYLAITSGLVTLLLLLKVATIVSNLPVEYLVWHGWNPTVIAVVNLALPLAPAVALTIGVTLFVWRRLS